MRHYASCRGCRWDGPERVSVLTAEEDAHAHRVKTGHVVDVLSFQDGPR